MGKKTKLTGGSYLEVLMLSPMFIGFLVFTIYPILWVARWATPILIFPLAATGLPILRSIWKCGRE